MSNQHDAYLTVEQLATVAMEGFTRLGVLAEAINGAREEPRMVMELANIAEELANDRGNTVDCIREEALRILRADQGGAK